jgi:inosose dehydratase
MEAVDTRYLKFGRDIGQLQKGGPEPVWVVKDFLPIVHHVHLKDFNGGNTFLTSCPLGRGRSTA